MAAPAWFAIVTATIIIAAAVKFALEQILRRLKRLPPGPASYPIIGNLLWLTKPLSDLELTIRHLKSRFGPIVGLRLGARPFIFIGNHSTAHRALIQNGILFADRPDLPPALKVMNRHLKFIITTSYGPTWRLFRRNLTQEMLHPSRVRAYAGSRRWVLSVLIHRLSDQPGSSGSPIRLIDHLQYTMNCLLVLMCFGVRAGEKQIKEIEAVVKGLMLGFRTFNMLYFFPRLGTILFRKSWKQLIQVLDDMNRVLLPLIRARIQATKTRDYSKTEDQILTYVDTLVDLHLPEENRKLDEEQMVTLCGEFLIAGTDTTSTAMQWIMANLVKHPKYQENLYQEIKGVVGAAPRIQPGEEENLEKVVQEEDLEKMPFLKAVVLEALRRHPPVQFVMLHEMKDDVEFDGYKFPKGAVVNFTVADMAWDPNVWEDPLEFKPERFLTGNREAFDITGSREIKMMPFGVGRRICPGLSLSLLHLEYFVANLIWYYEWQPVEGEEVDLSDEVEFASVMKKPLRARISERSLC